MSGAGPTDGLRAVAAASDDDPYAPPLLRRSREGVFAGAMGAGVVCGGAVAVAGGLTAGALAARDMRTCARLRFVPGTRT